MRCEFAMAFLLFLPLLFAAQQTPTTVPPTDVTAPVIADQSPPVPGTFPGLYKIGGRVSAPVVKQQVAAEYTDEAKEAKYQGVCLIGLIVDAHGKPQNIHVVRALSMGLDQKAIKAIRQYRFKPALLDRKTPVPVAITIEVDFRLY
jgi:TonB family protein